MNRELLKLKPYRALITAQTISNIGDWLNLLGLMALVGIKWHGSPIAVSVVMLMFSVPSIVFGSLAGTIADRMDRKRLMIVADWVRALIVVGIVFAPNLLSVYVLVGLLSLFSALFDPASQGKIKEVAPVHLIQSAVATSQLINNSTKIIGPILGGILIGTVSLNWAFYIDSASFVLSAFLLVALPKSPKRLSKNNTSDSEETNTSRGVKGFFHQLTDGFTLLKTTPNLLVGLIVFSLVMFVLQVSDSQFIILFREMKSSSINVLGLVMAGSGLGVALASIYLNKKELTSFIRTLAISSFVLGLGYIGLASFIHLPIIWIETCYPIGGVLVGFCFGLSLIPFEVMVQKQTPETHTGRVFGTINSVTTLSVILGTAIGGFISQAFGVLFTYDLAGGLLVLVGLVVYSKRKTLERGNDDAKSQPGTLQEAKSGNS